MIAFEVVRRHPSTLEKGPSLYLVTEEEKGVLGEAAEFEQVEVEPPVFLENKRTRSVGFSGWIFEHQRKAEGLLYQ